MAVSWPISTITLECWSVLEEICPDQKIIPITYVNSSAPPSSRCGGAHGGICLHPAATPAGAGVGGRHRVMADR